MFGAGGALSDAAFDDDWNAVHLMSALVDQPLLVDAELLAADTNDAELARVEKPSDTNTLPAREIITL